MATECGSWARMRSINGTPCLLLVLLLLLLLVLKAARTMAKRKYEYLCISRELLLEDDLVALGFFKSNVQRKRERKGFAEEGPRKSSLVPLTSRTGEIRLKRGMKRTAPAPAPWGTAFLARRERLRQIQYSDPPLPSKASLASAASLAQMVPVPAVSKEWT